LKDINPTLKIIIRGKPHTGKTTLIKELINQLNIPWAGFYTEEIRKNNKRVGFKIVDRDGKQKIFAHINLTTKYRVGKYCVDIQALDSTIEKVKKLTEVNLFIIDEIGKMELFSQKFKQLVIEVFNSSTNVIATMKFSSDPFCNKLLQLSSCLVFNLNSRNYFIVREKILTLIQSKFSAIQNI